VSPSKSSQQVFAEKAQKQLVPSGTITQTLGFICDTRAWSRETEDAMAKKGVIKEAAETVTEAAGSVVEKVKRTAGKLVGSTKTESTPRKTASASKNTTASAGARKASPAARGKPANGAKAAPSRAKSTAGSAEKSKSATVVGRAKVAAAAPKAKVSAAKKAPARSK
jgi:hypothetical protein